ncbi:hypothetical protein [Methylobacterium sp. ARG-1]|uniref:hypothetical protein n=1 Tax=Methylobacterium sp. ARG-1 TaxID=1692501 RepID=UPI0006A441C1|nr:hypothetical protein [Methylobacterium sp. ARG-1]KNY21735.1 hypothetical protein AKJ13_16015 [Methylobacterium sp. ARG-1]
MADRPILFSAPMVQALLAGRKTQTRRILKLPKWASTDPSHIEFGASGAPEVICRDTGCLVTLPLPYAGGDRLWVKETWRASYGLDWHDEALGRAPKPSDIPVGSVLEYLADGERELGGKIRPSLFMPRWASRLTLLVTEVRLERLNAMSAADAIAEGIQDLRTPEHSDFGIPGLVNAQHPVRAFWLLWDFINGEGAWLANPWVVAISFEVLRLNIDDVPVQFAPADALNIAGAA